MRFLVKYRYDKMSKICNENIIEQSKTFAALDKVELWRNVFILLLLCLAPDDIEG